MAKVHTPKTDHHIIIRCYGDKDRRQPFYVDEFLYNGRAVFTKTLDNARVFETKNDARIFFKKYEPDFKKYFWPEVILYEVTDILPLVH